MLERVNKLLITAEQDGQWTRRVCPNTGTEISGSKNGQGDGGFRLGSATTGAAMSSHKEAKAVDVYDPREELDAWISLFDSEEGRKNSLLEAQGLYREHPDDTHGWCHLTTRAPASGWRTYKP
jgi:hypothetical protein